MTKKYRTNSNTIGVLSGTVHHIKAGLIGRLVYQLGVQNLLTSMMHLQAAVVPPKKAPGLT